MNVVEISASTSKESIFKLEKLKDEKKLSDIFILDLILPGDIGGDVIIERFKQKVPNAYYVISTGCSEDFNKDKFQNYGFNDVLKKHYTIENLKILKTSFKKWKTNV